MNAIARDPQSAEQSPAAIPTSRAIPSSVIAYARHLYQLRRKREAAFGDLFGEPAWDMMLDLFISQSSGNLPAITSLCIAACVPATTALRWIMKLIDSGVIERQVDPFDRRRSFAVLTPHAYERMGEFLQSVMKTDRAYSPA